MGGADAAIAPKFELLGIRVSERAGENGKGFKFKGGRGGARAAIASTKNGAEPKSKDTGLREMRPQGGHLSYTADPIA